jgi:predicted NBD/HSP70 family sugar kinase
MVGSGAPSRLRVLNDQTALAAIVAAGEVSRADLTRLTGLSKPAVAELLHRLELAGLVEPAGTAGGGPGPRARTWRVRGGAGCCLAADVTTAGWALRLADLGGGRVLEQQGEWSGPVTAEAITEALRRGLADAGLDTVLAAAVGVPGAVDPRTGVVRGAPDLPELLGVDLGGVLRRALGFPVDVENDVNLMALAALAAGTAGETRSLAFVWIGAGLGAAVVRDGELIRGFTGGAGEIDYVRIPEADGALARLGDLLSPAGLEALVGDDLEAGLRFDEADGPVARELVRRLALGLVAIVTVLDPELVLIGGRYGAPLAERLGDALRAELARLLDTDLSFVPDLRAVAVEPLAALDGAEHLALRAARESAFRTGSLPSDAPLAQHPAATS